MGKFVIEGGRRISGKIKAESAKNAVLPILAASLLTDGEVIIKDCPEIADVKNMLAILSALGAKHRFSDGNLLLDCSGADNCSVPENLTRELRSSVLFAGALSAKFGRAEIALPGGCNIGKRPIDMHIDGLSALGIKGDRRDGAVSFACERLSGGAVELPVPSVGATENVMIAAAAAKGETVIKNAAKEPEIADLAEFINAIGGKVYGAGTETVRIVGVNKFSGTVYRPVFDRIETGTYLVAAAITGGEIEISGVRSEKFSALIGTLCDNSCKLTVKNDIIYLRSGKTRKPFYIRTGYYPAFPTDMQAQATALAAVSSGVSVIRESVFENRFGYVRELKKMGAEISVASDTAIVNGIKRFHGEKVTAADLRGGAALVLAGLNAEGKTVVDGASHIERGYVKMEKKLSALNADVIKTD